MEDPVLVPTVPVGMPSSTLCVFGAGGGTRVRPRRRFHAERGNEMNSSRRLAWRQWPGGVERVVPEILFLFLLLLFLLLLIIFLILVLLLLLLFLPPLCRPPRSACSAQAAGTRERPRRHSHAERGNEMNALRRLAWRQWPGGVERVVPEILFLFLLLLFLLLLIIFLILVLLLLPGLRGPSGSGPSGSDRFPI